MAAAPIITVDSCTSHERVQQTDDNEKTDWQSFKLVGQWWEVEVEEIRGILYIELNCFSGQ